MPTIRLITKVIDLAIAFVMGFTGTVLLAGTVYQMWVFGEDSVPVQRFLLILCLYAGAGLSAYVYNSVEKET